jgi:hypothetical protein
VKSDHLTYANGVEYCPGHGEEENCAEMVEKEPIGHKITGIQNDGRQHTEEEDGRRQWGQHGRFGGVQNASDGEPDDD